MKLLFRSFFLMALFALSVSGFSADTQNTSSSSSTKVLWDEWYTLTLQGSVPAAYYNERCEQDSRGRWVYKNKAIKVDEGFLNAESLTAIAESNPPLKPILFNFHGTYRSNETTIDGTFQSDGTLAVKIFKSGQELPVIKNKNPAQAFFSSFFPIFIRQKLQTLKINQTSNFQAILEDNEELSFAAQSGTIQLKPDDDFSKKTKTKKLSIVHAGQQSTWYVEASGLPVKIDFPARKAVIEKTTREKAEKFLQNAQQE